MHQYSTDFYHNFVGGSRRSAQVVVPILMEIFRPESVLDLGCGIGTWLSVFQESGIPDVFGVDGPWVDEADLLIDGKKFTSSLLDVGIDLQRQFGLVMSLEVAEHISAERASIFVSNLAKHGDTIVFSAAPPGQGGENHINEQYPEYWIELFHAQGMVAVDGLRWLIWNDEQIEPWYRQNVLIFTKPDKANIISNTLNEMLPKNTVFNVIHPQIFEYLINSTKLENIGIRKIANQLPRLILGAIRRYILSCFQKPG